MRSSQFFVVCGGATVSDADRFAAAHDGSAVLVLVRRKAVLGRYAALRCLCSGTRYMTMRGLIGSRRVPSGLALVRRY
eukprot:3259159-Prymnesium_polylepis.1